PSVTGVVEVMTPVRPAAMGSGQVRARRGGVLVPRRRGDEREPDLDEGPAGHVPDRRAAAACEPVLGRRLVLGPLGPALPPPLPGDLFHGVGVHLCAPFLDGRTGAPPTVSGPRR